MKLLIVGYGRMGRLVDALAPEYGFEVVGRIDRASAERPEEWPAADVAIDFSVAGAVPANLRRLAARGTDVVVGTTGWVSHEVELRRVVEDHGVGVVAAPNFAPGVNLFVALAGRVAELMAPHAAFGAWIHELHHAAKRDAPSGTALLLESALREHGYERPVDVASTRAGQIPGTHTVGFDGAGETITLTHSARDRTPFARGALDAAKWIRGRRGWFAMNDVMGS